MKMHYYALHYTILFLHMICDNSRGITARATCMVVHLITIVQQVHFTCYAQPWLLLQTVVVVGASRVTKNQSTAACCNRVGVHRIGR